VTFARALVAAAVSVAMLAPTPAHAAELADVTLTWEAPPGCPARETLLVRVAELVGQRGGEQPHAPLEVRASVTRQPEGNYRAELRTLQDGDERTRTLDAESCLELTEASAVVIALAISPPLEAPPPVVPAPVPPPAAPEPVTEDKLGPPEGRRRPSTIRVGAEGGLALDFGTIAPVAAGVALGLSGRYSSSLEHVVRISIFPRRRSSVAGHPEGGMDIGLVTGALQFCFAPTWGRFELAGCGEFELGMLHVEGVGTNDRYGKDSPWIAPGAGLRAAFPSGNWFRASVTADLLIPTGHTEFVVTNVGVARQIPPLTGRLGIFAELLFL
jgi:hypothetical protein